MTHNYTDEMVERDLAFAIEIARFAGDRVLGLSRTGRWEGSMLADIGDQAADGYLQGVIQGRFPDDGILSEETVDTPERLVKERCWIIDPLDGTREFSQLRDDWGVHVALTLNKACAIGVVYLPSQDLLIWGVALPGRERVGLEGQGQLVSAADGTPDRIVVSRSHTPPWVEAFAAAIGAKEMVPFGGAGNKTCKLLTARPTSTSTRKASRNGTLVPRKRSRARPAGRSASSMALSTRTTSPTRTTTST